MKLSELKTKLLANEKISLPLIFIESNNDYIVKEYINQISKNNSLAQREISSINEMIDIEAGMFKEKDYLYVYQYNNKDQIIFDDLKNLYNLFKKYNAVICIENLE